jgi:hypothetical protein
MAASFSPKPLTIILAPCFANAIAIAKPMPLVEPVTNAVLPLNWDMFTFSRRVLMKEIAYNENI